MAERYEDQYRREHGYRRDERGFIDRAGDEVRSWFGDDEAERRRQLDDRQRMRESGQRGDGPSPGYYDRGAYYRPVTRDALGDRGNALSDSGYADRSYGGYTDRAFAGTYDRGSWDRDDRAYGPGRADAGRDRPDPGYRSDGWRGMNYPSTPSYGNREQARSYAGQGPRGYQRSDTRINEDVCDRLCESPDVDARNIEVTVSNGEVTLNGSVSDRDQKRRAEDLIEQVSGVSDVRNNLRVARGDEASSASTASSPMSGTNTTSASGTTGTTGRPGTTGEQPGNVLGVGGGAPDRASTAGGR